MLLSVAFLVGVGTGGAAARDRASEAAVGANKPELEDGVFGLVTPAAAGVFGRAADAGVLGRLGEGLVDAGRGVRAGVDRPGLLAVDRADVPVCCGRSGTCADGGERGDRVGVPVLDAARAAVRDAGDLAGVAAAGFLAAGLLVTAAGWGDVASSALADGEGNSARADSGSSSGAGSALGSGVSSTAGGVTIVGCATGSGFDFSEYDEVCTGGHSRFSLISPVVESPVV